MSKKNCVMARSAPASTLRFRLSRSAAMEGRLGMNLRIGSHADLEIVHAFEARHQFGCVRESFRMLFKLHLSVGRIAAQGDDVAHAGRPIGSREIFCLTARCAHASHVRGGGNACFPGHLPHHGKCALAIGAVGSRGHRKELRTQRGQSRRRATERGGGFGGFGREEFKRYT